MGLINTREFITDFTFTKAELDWNGRVINPIKPVPPIIEPPPPPLPGATCGR